MNDISRSGVLTGSRPNAQGSLNLLGQPEETIRSVERATRLSPRDPNVGHWIAFIGMAELHRGRYSEAVT